MNSTISTPQHMIALRMCMSPESDHVLGSSEG